MSDKDPMKILHAADIVGTKAYDALTYTKWKDGIDVDYPTVELSKIIKAVTSELQAEKAEMEGEYVEREGILSVKVDRMQIEIDMLRRVSKSSRIANKSLERLIKQAAGYLSGYKNDADDATHAKRLLDNYLASIIPPPAQQQEPTE